VHPTHPVGIIGAGPAGIAAAVALQARDIPFEIVEAGPSIGGIWDIDRAETPMYEAAHFISSRTMSGYPGFPMPDDYPDYPRHDQILKYVRSYADHHGVTERVEFGRRVTRATPLSGEGPWEVELADGSRRTWSAVITATGTNWEQNVPSVPGVFDGEQLHSFAFRSGDTFAGKRVLIVGGGNSGIDIACEAARYASRAYLSLRRGYHFIPKYIMGKPADVFAHDGPVLPWRIEEVVFGFLINTILVGNLKNYGLPKPDHPLLRSHPIMNTQILHHLGHGDIAARPDVKELRGRKVLFTDGREEEIDLIVWATGYRRTFPFLAETGAGKKLDLYLELFHRTRPDLFYLGVFETDGAAYPLHAQQAALVAAYLAARAKAPDTTKGFDAVRATARPNLRGGRPYIDSLRHEYYVSSIAYPKELARAARLLGMQTLKDSHGAH